MVFKKIKSEIRGCIFQLPVLLTLLNKILLPLEVIQFEEKRNLCAI